MTVAQAAVILEVRPATVYALCRAGLIGHRRVGLGKGQIRLDRADVDAYLESSRVECRGPSAPAAVARTARAVASPIGEARAERERRRAGRADRGTNTSHPK